MLRDADAAMYRAKRRGPGAYELFDSAVRAQVLTRLRTEAELRTRSRRGALPALPADPRARQRQAGRERGARPLEHPHHGLVPPLDFISVAEETGLISELGRYVFAGLRTGAAWQRQFDVPLQDLRERLGLQLVNPAFPAEVAGIATSSGLLSGTLGLEVTESVLIEGDGTAINVLGSLHKHGVGLMLDDFGTGYSCRLPAELPARRRQDRPLVHRRAHRQSRGRGDHPSDHRHVQRVGPHDGGRGRRVRIAARAPELAGLRLRPGLPPVPSDGGRGRGPFLSERLLASAGNGVTRESRNGASAALAHGRNA